MKKLLIACLVAIVTLPALADIVPPGKVMGRTQGNVTGASPRETALLRVYKSIPIGPDDGRWLARLVILSPGGKTLWTSPPADEGPFCFSGGVAGDDALEVAGPFEKAGQGEVVIHTLQSDVRVDHFAIFRWDGKKLALVRTSGLVETPVHSGHFVWNGDREPRSRWITKIHRIIGPGRLEVEIASMDAHGHVANAVVVARPDGFALTH